MPWTAPSAATCLSGTRLPARRRWSNTCSRRLAMSALPAKAIGSTTHRGGGGQSAPAKATAVISTKKTAAQVIEIWRGVTRMARL